MTNQSSCLTSLLFSPLVVAMVVLFTHFLIRLTISSKSLCCYCIPSGFLSLPLFFFFFLICFFFILLCHRASGCTLKSQPFRQTPPKSLNPTKHPARSDLALYILQPSSFFLDYLNAPLHFTRLHFLDPGRRLQRSNWTRDAIVNFCKRDVCFHTGVGQYCPGLL